MDIDLEAHLRALLGPYRVIADHTWPEWREALVLELADAEGVRWFLKRHRRAEGYRAELRAYQRWVPVLGPHAPRLGDADDPSQSLVISAVAGRRPEQWVSPQLQHDAGALLRRFHDAEDLGPWEDMVAAKTARLEFWAARGGGLVDRQLVGAVRARLKALEGIGPVRCVPSHRDYSPRNWLVSDGQLHVIDFGDAGPDVWVHDFGRLLLSWRLPPQARAAFFDGYGRTPTEEDMAVLRASYAADLVFGIVWTHEHTNAKLEASLRELLVGLLADDLV
ncbi:MAG TPA: aminoglycoside phosphotransferase family protein [Acidimicrobiales bacterium]|nr:aminoglycoside phosphotransferase family protein [Acidimicrobiales bacterium]